MQLNNTEIRLLIRGKPITEYEHNGDLFVEGREGSEFEIEVTNRNAFRVEAVISVDGLSITDGESAGPQSGGYLVDAHSSVRIPGWKLSEKQVAAFFFSGKKRSYATQTTGSSRNNGVIGAMVFAERNRYGSGWKTHEMKNPYPAFRGITTSQPLPYSPLRSAGGGFVYQSGAASPSFDTMWTNNTSSMTNSVGANAMSSTISTSCSLTDDYMCPPPQNGVKRGSRLKSLAPKMQLAQQNNIGTGFGAAQSYKTEVVEFQRGDMIAVMVLYYDDARGLRSRGIEVGRRVTRQVAAPQAFPSMNCKPPKGWTG